MQVGNQGRTVTIANLKRRDNISSIRQYDVNQQRIAFSDLILYIKLLSQVTNDIDYFTDEIQSRKCKKPERNNHQLTNQLTYHRKIRFFWQYLKLTTKRNEKDKID